MVFLFFFNEKIKYEVHLMSGGGAFFPENNLFSRNRLKEILEHTEQCLNSQESQHDSSQH